MTTKQLNKKLDDAWSKAVKIKDGYKCQYCGKETHLNSHHIYSRSNYSTRWDLDNGITLCVGHHTFSSSFSAHKTPLEFIKWLEKQKSIEELEELTLKANSTVKLTKPDKEEILEFLTNYIKENE